MLDKTRNEMRKITALGHLGVLYNIHVHVSTRCKDPVTTRKGWNVLGCLNLYQTTVLFAEKLKLPILLLLIYCVYVHVHTLSFFTIIGQYLWQI